MPDVTGYRAKFAAIVPSTNTVVEHDFNLLAPPGVTIHAGRFMIDRPALSNDEEFLDLINQVLNNVGDAVASVKTCKPDYYVMGMSAGTFWNGIAGNRDFEARIDGYTGGVPCSTGATACREVLTRFGVRRISVLTPYQPIADKEVANYFTESGFDEFETALIVGACHVSKMYHSYYLAYLATVQVLVMRCCVRHNAS